MRLKPPHFKIVAFLYRMDRPMNPNEIARYVEISRITAIRYLQTLEKYDIVNKTTKNGRTLWSANKEGIMDALGEMAKDFSSAHKRRL